MPFLDRPDGRIRYEVHGAGFPVLLFAPGGLRSRVEMWPSPARRPGASLGGLDPRIAARGRLHRHRHGPAQRRRVAHRRSSPTMAGTPMPPTTWR